MDNSKQTQNLSSLKNENKTSISDENEELIDEYDFQDFTFSNKNNGNNGNEDENEIIAFAKSPFGGIESREVFFQNDDEFNEDIKSVGADPLSSFINRRAFQNTEKLEFSDPTVVDDKNFDVSLVQNFMAVRPEMFLFNFDPEEYARELAEKKKNLEEKNKIIENASSTENKKGQKKNELAPENEDDLEELEEFTDVVLLQEDFFSGFLFSTFAENYGKITELHPEIIIQKRDGIYSIANDFSVADIKQNLEFKNLVDSVLNN